MNLARANISSLTGQSERAESLFLAIIASKEAYTEPEPDALYEAFAKLGISCVSWNRFTAAVDLLQKASILMPNGYLREYIALDLGYSLQTLKRFDEAKECLRDALENGPGELKSEVYYRLGSVQSQAGEYEAAIESFQRALSSLPHGRITKSDILAALQEVKEEQNINPADRPGASIRAKTQTQ